MVWEFLGKVNEKIVSKLAELSTRSTLFHVIGVLYSLCLTKSKGKEMRARLMAESFALYMPFMEKNMTAIKKTVFSTIQAHTTPGKPYRVLELGAGAGNNLEHYPSGTELTVVDPNTHFKEHLLQNLKEYPQIRFVEFIPGYGEDLSEIESGSMDAVVTSSVQCSVSNIQQVLKEIHRVLVPGGKYFFAEHILDFKPGFRRVMQRLFDGLWSFTFEGCHFRDIHAEFRKSKLFLEENLEEHFGYFPMETSDMALELARPFYYGIATKEHEA